MKSTRRRICALMAVLLPVGVTGCFGDNILSAAAKLASGQISDLTAGEIKILNDLAIGVLQSQNPGFNAPALSDGQAEALSVFFKANQLNTVEDFQQLSQTAQTDPSAIQGLDALAQAFAGSGMSIDPNNFDPNTIDEIFGAIFGGSGLGSGTGGGSLQGSGSGGTTQTGP